MINFRNRQQALKIKYIMSTSLIGTHLIMLVMQIEIHTEIVRPIAGLINGAPFTGSPIMPRRSADPAIKVLKVRKMAHSRIADLKNIAGIIG